MNSVHRGLATVGFSLLVAAVGSRLEAQATRIVLPEIDFLIRATDVWAAASPLGSIRSREMDSSDIELRIWTGFGSTGTEGLALRRSSGKWSSWTFYVEHNAIRVQASIVDTASPATMELFRKLARAAPQSSIGYTRFSSQEIADDRLVLAPLPTLAADSLWARLRGAGIRELPLENAPSVTAMVSGSTHAVIELREGNSYRASQIQTGDAPDTAAKRKAMTIVNVALIPAKAMRSSSFHPSQPTSRAFTSAADDTTAARQLMISVFERAAYDVAGGAVQTKKVPWVVTLPKSRSVDWVGYESHFMEAVGGRPLTPADSVRSSLYVRIFEMRGDTLVGIYGLSGASKCHGQWWGGGTEYEMRSVRHGTAWEMPRTTAVLHFDSFSCPSEDPSPRKPPPGSR